MLFPAEIEFIFPFNFCTDLRFASNPCQIYMYIAGFFATQGFPILFMGKNFAVSCTKVLAFTPGPIVALFFFFF